MRFPWLPCLLLASCVPSTLAAPAPSAVRWIPVEKEASRLDYGAGDGAVTEGERVLVLVPAPASPRGRRAPPGISLPSRVEVGEIFRIEIRVPRAEEGEVRTFRLRCGRPGLRLLDGDMAVTVGRRPTVRRAVADSAGPASFDLDDVGD
jgi:hypothetical protein